MHGVDGHYGERVDLLAGLHRAELGSHRGTGASRQHDGGQHRAKLAHQNEGNDGAERALGSEAAQGVVTLQPEHHAGEAADQNYQEQRIGTDDPYLPYPQPRLIRREENVSDRVQQEQREVAEVDNAVEHKSAEPLNHFNDRHQAFFNF